MKTTPFVLALCTGILITAILVFAQTSHASRPAETYEVVQDGNEKLLLFKSKTISDLIKTRNDSQMSEAEKVQLIKSKLFVDAVSIGDNKSYCDQASVLYQDRKNSKEAISKACNSLITTKDFIEPVALEGIDTYDLRSINKMIAGYLKILIFFSL